MTKAKIVLVGADGQTGTLPDDAAQSQAGAEWITARGETGGPSKRAFQRAGHAIQFCGEKGEEAHAMVYVERPMELLAREIERADRDLEHAMRMRTSLPMCADLDCELEVAHTMCGKIP